MIVGEVGAHLVFEFLELLAVVAGNPARGVDIDRFELAIDAILVLEPVGDDVELRKNFIVTNAREVRNLDF